MESLPGSSQDGCWRWSPCPQCAPSRRCCLVSPLLPCRLSSLLNGLHAVWGWALSSSPSSLSCSQHRAHTWSKHSKRHSTKIKFQSTGRTWGSSVITLLSTEDQTKAQRSQGACPSRTGATPRQGSPHLLLSVCVSLHPSPGGPPQSLQEGGRTSHNAQVSGRMTNRVA